jgi:hypothetical protein
MCVALHEFNAQTMHSIHNTQRTRSRIPCVGQSFSQERFYPLEIVKPVGALNLLTMGMFLTCASPV